MAGPTCDRCGGEFVRNDRGELIDNTCPCGLGSPRECEHDFSDDSDPERGPYCAHCGKRW